MPRNAKGRKRNFSRNIPELPEELLVMIFNACPASDRAVLLQVSKHFHELGVGTLYRSIFITSYVALKLLKRTLAGPNASYAKMLRTFKVILVESSTRQILAHHFITKSQDILFESNNIENLQIYAPDLLTTARKPLIWEVSFPRCLTSFTMGIYWHHISQNSFETLFKQLTSLEHLSIQCIGDFYSHYSVDVKAILPNLISYQGPSILLQSLAQESKKLSSLILEVFTPCPDIDLNGPVNPIALLSEDRTLKHLKKIGSKDNGERDVNVLSYLKIICDSPAAANVAMEFLPQVEHLSLLFPAVVQSLPWDMAVVAESLGKMNSSLGEVNILLDLAGRAFSFDFVCTRKAMLYIDYNI
ncbi:hypothetical protein GGU10DRAFT_409650 [Lentinula aff. detonsa]|uniref:F-box domain-containing protein n=1 Tax=Lentinula aff. detonsa TaxID=2804958 RepID=A0AA38KMA7_9AGAR|nr:hypothetical protein GGU10DRAFT_409650 [Lentinula aff. detonsa]